MQQRQARRAKHARMSVRFPLSGMRCGLMTNMPHRCMSVGDQIGFELAAAAACDRPLRARDGLLRGIAHALRRDRRDRRRCTFEPQGEGRVARGDRCAQLSSRRRPRGPSRRHRAGHDREARAQTARGTGRVDRRPRRHTARRGRHARPLRPPAALSCSSTAPTHRCRPRCWRRATRWSRPTVTDKDCAASLVAAEAAARAAKRGIWADPAAIKNAESPGDILAGIGRFMVVEGKVLSVRQAGATTYLNFGRNWTRDFAVTISRRMMPAFEAAGIVP